MSALFSNDNTAFYFPKGNLSFELIDNTLGNALRAKLTGKNSMMQIFVDGDACPAVCKDMLYRVAERLQLNVTLVANQLLRVPGSRFIRALQVPAGLDVADLQIVRLLAPGDLVITADIPLAGLVLDKGGFALNPRGEFYTMTISPSG
jgi:uncharacterized protein YaiI (UPF0178 family)